MWLVKQAQTGDADAFVKLVEQNKIAMFKVAKSYLKNDEDVADVMSETVLQAFEHIGDLHHPEFFKTWLIRILINQCKAVLQKQKRYVLTEEMDERELEENSFSDVYFRDILSELSQKDQWIFTLYYEEGYTTKQIAKIIDMKENTIISRLNRGRKKLFLSFARNCQ